jgi:hypothetical protein
LERLLALVEADPDAVLEMLRQRPGLSGSIMLVWRVLKKLGITVQNESQRAAGRDRPAVWRECLACRRRIKRIEPERLVFVDEAGVTTVMMPRYGRAPRGDWFEDPAPASWESVTAVGALEADRVRVPPVLPGAVDATVFRSGP